MIRIGTATSPVPCACCGERARTWVNRANGRCAKHEDRNPCAIEGCRCTTKAGRFLQSDLWLCAKHWRPLTTKRERAAYSAVFRRAKKMVGVDGEWPQRLLDIHWRIWFMIVARARRRSAGDIDMVEIERMFGWEAHDG